VRSGELIANGLIQTAQAGRVGESEGARNDFQRRRRVLGDRPRPVSPQPSTALSMLPPGSLVPSNLGAHPVVLNRAHQGSTALDLRI
jgi:hypothetical protein